MNEYLSGNKLIGDDYTLDQIEEWYNDEKEGFANLGAKNAKNYIYDYHNLNKIHFFKSLDQNKVINRALGFGSAYGHEFYPLINRIKELHIIEPSDHLVSRQIGDLAPIYKKPHVDGTLDYPDDHFDLITCFGVLHHIPNVSYVLKEFGRVIKPNGFILIREPIVSMGDWSRPRPGLTSRERGIPLTIFKKALEAAGLFIMKYNYSTSMTSFIQRKTGLFFKRKVVSYLSYALFDKLLSKLLSWNISYHQRGLKKIAPQAINLILRKNPK